MERDGIAGDGGGDGTGGRAGVGGGDGGLPWRRSLEEGRREAAAAPDDGKLLLVELMDPG